jgi:hypothetical protein
MRKIFITAAALLFVGTHLTGCITDQQPTIEVPKYQVVVPPDQLYQKCRDHLVKKKDLPEIEGLTDAQVGDLITRLWNAQMTCYASNEEIRKYIAKSKTAVEQPQRR